MNLVKKARQYFAERPKAAFTSAQIVRLLKSAGLVDEEPKPEAVFAAVKALVAQGHVSSRVDPDTGDTLYQVTPDGVAKWQASP